MRPKYISKVATGGYDEDLQQSIQNKLNEATAEGYELQSISHAATSINDDLSFSCVLIFKDRNCEQY